MMRKEFAVSLKQNNHHNFAFTCKDFDLILIVGTLLSRDNKALYEEVQLSSRNGAKIVYLMSMEDNKLSLETTFFSRYEVGSEEGVFALLGKGLLAKSALSLDLQNYFNDLDEGYLSAESNVGEEEIDEIISLCQGSQNTLLILGEDLYTHPRASNIAFLAGLISNFGKAKILIPDLQKDEITLVEDTTEVLPEEICALKSFDGTIVYGCDALFDDEAELLIGSAQFRMAAKVQNGEKIHVAINQEMYPRTFVLDDSLKGTIALMPRTLKNDTSYRYHVAKIVK